MSCDSYYRHKVIMDAGANIPTGEGHVSFKDDRELLAYLLEQERREALKQKSLRDREYPA
jgi:hypothetical protein